MPNNEIFLPVLHHFENGNVFTGSCGALRFKVTPAVVRNGREVDLAASTIRAEYWHGPMCYECSEIEGEKTFPMSTEGRQAMQEWLEQAI